MRLLLTMSPTILLIVYGQLITKWRIEILAKTIPETSSAISRLMVYLTDPYILSAYVAAVAGSIAWMFVVEHYAISLAFPIYIGLTVLLVVIGGTVLFDEQLTASRVVAVFLIILGVALGSRP
jgi:multidrug transporter EmrE-like cation transporter